jgi:pimeloyl-ACP methyl ester carboxylesterase
LGAPVHKAICLNGVTPAEVTYRGFAEALAGRAVLLLKDLEGYANEYPTNYDWETEVTAIARITEKRGWQQFHVMGYSAGASVALGFACSFPDRVESLSLIEPWFVGNDVSWSQEYARLLESVDTALNLPLQERFAAFLQAFTPEQEPLPPMPRTSQFPWVLTRSERQGRMWPQWRDPARGPRQLIPPRALPLHITVGAATHPAILVVARNLARQFPKATLDIYQERNHFDAPQVREPLRFADAVKSKWEQSQDKPG